MEMPNVLNITQVARELGISRPTVYNLIAEGVLTTYRHPANEPRGAVWVPAEQVAALKPRYRDRTAVPA